MTQIPTGCCWNCFNLIYVFIPKSIISIFSNSFVGCYQLFEKIPGDKRVDIEFCSGFTFEILEKCQFEIENCEEFVCNSFSNLKIPCHSSRSVNLCSFREKLDEFENWIFISEDFEFFSLNIQVDIQKTIFIILEKNVEKITHEYPTVADGNDKKSSQVKENYTLKSVYNLKPLLAIGKDAFNSFTNFNQFHFQILS